MKVAFGKIKLTPPTGYKGRGLSGYIPSPTCNGKYDDIYGHMVLIEETVLGNIPKYLVLISLDFLKVPMLFTDYCKEKIQDKFQIHPYQILIHATHTHKSFDMGGEFAFPGHYLQFIRSIMFGAYQSDDYYKVWIAYQLVILLGELKTKLEPAKMAWGKKELPEEITINRRHPERIVPTKIAYLSFKSLKDNRLLGIVLNFAAHPTTLNNHIRKMSADYPGRFVHRISELTNQQTMGIFFTGAAGDMNPITTCGTDHDALVKNQYLIYGQQGNYTHTKKMGYYLAEKTLEVVKNIPESDYFDSIEYKCYNRTFWVPLDNYSRKVKPLTYVANKIIFAFKKYFLFSVALTLGDAMEPNFPGFAAKHRGHEINCYSYIHLIKIQGKNKTGTKQLSIVGIPGELFEDYGKDIMEKSPTGPENTFIIENGNDWIGYLLPLKEYITASGWEIFSSFSPIVGAYVRNNYLYLLRDIKRKTTAGYY